MSRRVTADTRDTRPVSTITALKTKYYENVVMDIVIAERGKQWPFSCYGPSPENPNIPDLEDVSPEELRFRFYQVLRNGGNINEYQTYVDQLKKKVDDMRSFLKQPSKELEKMIAHIMSTKNPLLVQNATTTEAFASFKFAFDGKNENAPTQNTSTIFRKAEPKDIQQSGNIFGNVSPSPSSVLALQKPSHATQSSIFGGPHLNTQQPIAETKVLSDVKPPDNCMIYSKEQDLLEEERNMFMAQTFTFGKIPTKPPPQSLC